MYGFINTCLKSLVVETFGEETWIKLRDEAGVQDTFLTHEVYKDEITMQLIAEACKLLGVKPEVVLRQFGVYFFEFCKRSGYDHMLRTLGGNLVEFTENLDALHSYLSLSYKVPNLRPLSLTLSPLLHDLQSVGCSHSVRANVQSVLSLLKRHQPHLCNCRVLSNSYETGSRRHSDSSSSSSSSSASGEDLSELLQALQEELRLMSLEQDELMRQVEASVSEQERKELQREQERLLLKMERKGEQISKLYKHKTQIKKLRKEATSRRSSGNEVRLTTTVSTRGHSTGAVKVRPGERSKRNLRLLRDMKALQTSLRT